MPNTPFFTVLIPTKNRNELIQKAIESVLNQTFTDYELIIVDNNISSETENIVRKFDNEKIKYFRTGNLNMPDNWEYAFSKSSGEYITVLTDRMFYASEHVLDQIYKCIQKYKESIITWRWSKYDENKDEIIGYSHNVIIKEFSSKDVLSGFLQGGDRRHWFNVTSPKGLNSCIPRQTYEKAINKYGRLFYHIAPDFTSCFILLNMEAKIIHIEDGLVVSGGHNQSNGINAIKDKKKLISYIEELDVAMEIAYKFTPIKVLSVFNLMYNDLFFISHKLNWGLSWDMVNKTEYYALVHDEIVNNFYEPDKEEDLKSWNRALQIESREIRNSILRKIGGGTHEKRNTPITFLRKIFSHKIIPLINRI